MTFCSCCKNLGSIRGKPGLIPCPACRSRRPRPSLLRTVRAWDFQRETHEEKMDEEEEVRWYGREQAKEMREARNLSRRVKRLAA